MTADTAEREIRWDLLDGQRKVLERITSGGSLQEVSDRLVRLIEDQATDLRCAVLLADAAQERLRFIAAPNIPQDYVYGIEPYLLIAPNMGSCGTAAFLHEPVYARDILTDPRWKHCGHVAFRNGFRAIWSTPILSADDIVLGTFAMYYEEPRLPSAQDVQFMDMATQMARVAIEHNRNGSRLVNLQEIERRELARELHDRVGQSLTALGINMAILRQTLSGNDAGIMSRLEDSAALVESSMQSIENVLSDLRPPMLDDYGLPSTLEWYARQFSARTGISVAVRTGEPYVRSAAEVELALFRISQEALNNVAKHASASKVEILLQSSGSQSLMSVVDNGVGPGDMETRLDSRRQGLGMVTMKERAQAVGGEVRIEPLPVRGTRLSARIPK
jgi:signal transduction histidine kinase